MWGIAGGLVSLHTCLDNSERKQAVNSCCCNEVDFAKKVVSQSDCCKTITSYVGIPLYFVENNTSISIFEGVSFIISEIASPLINSTSPPFLSVHPPPQSQFLAQAITHILVMRI